MIEQARHFGDVGRPIGLGLDDSVRRGGKIADLRKQLKAVYGDRIYKADISEIDDEGVLGLVGWLSERTVLRPLREGAR